MIPGRCPACNAVVDIGMGDPDLEQMAFCGRCGLRWETAVPTGDILTAAYETGFYEAAAPRGGRLVSAFHSFNGTLRMRELRDLPNGRLLDLGCGKGHFLSAARSAGWDAVGIDHSRAAAEAAKRLYDIDIIVGDIADTALRGPFDVVTMWHVLEHVPEPAAILERIRPILRPGGRLVVSVPNLESIQARAFGRHWFHLDRQHHVSHFTPTALQALLERCGYGVEHTGYLYPEMEAVGFVQSVLNWAGQDRDELYRFIKRDRTVHLDRGVLASTALALLSAPFGLSLAVTMPLIKAGASMQFSATARTIVR
jgi:2-polyprenyl-3-methyl-5-hydroxy-6-metoxy-1,4-benzoquinol methylase